MSASPYDDLYALRGTIRALLHDVCDPHPGQLSLHSAQQLQDRVATLQRRADALLSSATTFVRPRAEHLLTDGCAEIAGMEAQRLRTKGRIVTLLADEDPAADLKVRMLRGHYEMILDELAALRSLTAAIRARLDADGVEPG